ncbi:MAG: zinc-binding alcohol dehydrogenase family protein [Alistipes sp.]|nr:zinc-binding alcohol dehydrogenase family protein [Rikenellaceae bacterium]MBQ7297786.1 zinc-binding alcohol dehydrogenase family protein [Alistipes sp.]
MKAVQIVAPSEMRVVEVEQPKPQAGEVLVKMCYVGYCGSDLNTYLGRNPMVQLPVIPGHEIGGEIAALGEGVPASLTVGQTVTINPYTNCGTCASCLAGRVNACQFNQTLGVQRNGAMSDYIVVPWQKVIPADGVSPRDAALIEPMSVGFHAVERAEVTDLDVVMVIGCGMIGVGAIVRAALRGATVIAADIDDEKLALAKELGATYTVNTMQEDVHARLQELTGGHGPNVVIEAVGSPITYVMAVDEVAFAGRVVCIGYAKSNVEFQTKLFVQKELDIRGSRNAMPSDFRAVIRFFDEHPAFPKERLISAIATPETAEEVMKQWAEAPGKVFRILVKF